MPDCFRVTAKVLQQAQGTCAAAAAGCLQRAALPLRRHAGPRPCRWGRTRQGRTRRDQQATSRNAGRTCRAGRRAHRGYGIEWRVLDEQAPPASPEDERRYDDNSPLPDEYDDEEYSPPVPQRRETDAILPTEEFEERQQDLALSEPEDWTDILEEVSAGDIDSFAVEEELVAIHNELSPGGESAPASEVNEFDVEDDAEPGLVISDDVMTDEVPQLDAGETEADEPIDDEESLIEEIEAVAVAIDEDLAGGEDDVDAGLDTDGVESEPADAVDDQEGPLAAPADDDEGAADEDIDASLELALDADIDDEEPEEDIDAAEEEAIELSAEEPEVPEPTEEEMTINMEIDEQMMAAAQGDDEFSKTLVGVEDPEALFDENAEGVETIIMEGEFIRSEVEKERLAAENAARSQLDDPARLADTYALNREKYRRRSYDPPAMGLVAAIAALTLLLIGQYIHNSRDSLATYGFFQQTVAPVYRVFGSPVTPAWDIKGWQFEATSGNVDEEETQLTIVSRIVNRSELPLPFPLVHVSLTNRFEDVMGSRVLEPADYLPDDLDPSELVSPGVNFNAVIVIEQPSPEATGFKLNVCYRVRPGSCAAPSKISNSEDRALRTVEPDCARADAGISDAPFRKLCRRFGAG